MYKYLFGLLVINFFGINKAISQKSDTIITYQKSYKVFNTTSSFKASTIDSADFIRLVILPKSPNKDILVTEYYKNRQLRLIGKYDNAYLRNGAEILTGECMTFHPNGHKASIKNYVNGFKMGIEYLFYPNGRIYCSIKHDVGRYKVIKPVNWDCYDEKGIKICSNGEGQWIVYDEDFKPMLAGTIKNGLFEGEWHGKTMEADSITYTYQYKKGDIISATGYDKNGVAYPFKNYLEESSIRSDVFKFVAKMRRNFILPKGIDIKKRNLDTAFVSFILEKDGSFSNAEVIGKNEPLITEALKNALNKCRETPGKYYGIPIRSKIRVSFKEVSTSTYYFTRKTINIKETILGFY